MQHLRKKEDMSAEREETPIQGDTSINDGTTGEETKRELIAALQQNWLHEMEGVRTYRNLAHNERDTTRHNVLEKLAEAEARHAARWERKLAELGAELPEQKLTLGMRFKGWLHRQVGTEAALRQLEGEENKDIARYEAQARSINDTEAQAMVREVRREEEGHGRIIREIVSPIGPQGMLDLMLRRERWHKRGGGWLGNAIYGANHSLLLHARHPGHYRSGDYQSGRPLCGRRS